MIQVALGLFFIAVVGTKTISTPEVWTHLAQGQSRNPISCLQAEEVVNTSYLYDRLFLALWETGGAPLVTLLNVLALLGAFSLLLPVSGKWGNATSQGFALLIMGHLIFQTVDVGPEVTMMLLTATFISILSTVKNPAVQYAVLIPLQALWTNLHASFFLGPCMAAVFAVQQAQPDGRRKEPKPKSRGMILLVVLLLLSTLINPHLLKQHAQVMANIQHPNPVYWSSLFTNYFQIPPRNQLLLFVAILSGGGLIAFKRRLPTAHTVLAAIGLMLAWDSARMSLLGAVLIFPFTVLSLQAVGGYVGGLLGHLLHHRRKALPVVTQAVFTVLLVLSALSFFNNKAYVRTASASTFGLGVEESLYPSDIEDLLTHPAFPEKAINMPADGGYLAFKYGRTCFLDYRPGCYDVDTINDLNALMLGSKEAYDRFYQAHRPEAFIINTLYPTAAQGIVVLLRQGTWKLTYFDGTTAILLHDKEEYAALFGNKELQARGLASLEKSRKEYASAIGTKNVGNPAPLIGAGKVFLALNRPNEAKAIFSLLLKGYSAIPGAWLGLGNSQLMLKEFESAADTLKHATKILPNSITAWVSYERACRYAGRLTEQSEARLALEQLSQRENKDPVDEAPAEKDEDAANPVSPGA